MEVEFEIGKVLITTLLLVISHLIRHDTIHILYQCFSTKTPFYILILKSIIPSFLTTYSFPKFSDLRFLWFTFFHITVFLVYSPDFHGSTATLSIYYSTALLPPQLTELIDGSFIHLFSNLFV